MAVSHGNENVAEAKNKFYPEVKLWIFDCVNMQEHPKEKDAYTFKDMMVKFVDIVGVVVGVQKFKDSSAGYIIDDGTGAIMVMYKHSRQNIIAKKNAIVSLRSELTEVPGFSSQEHEMLDYMMNQIQRVHEEVLEYRKVGETVHAIGKPYDFRNERHISAFHLSVVDINYETDRIFEMIKLYNNYNCINT